MFELMCVVMHIVQLSYEVHLSFLGLVAFNELYSRNL